MTAPRYAEGSRPGQEYRHSLCYKQALRRPLARVCICGHNAVGGRRPDREAFPPCPDCVALVDRHRAACPACRDAGWVPGRWPHARP